MDQRTLMVGKFEIIVPRAQVVP